MLASPSQGPTLLAGGRSPKMGQSEPVRVAKVPVTCRDHAPGLSEGGGRRASRTANTGSFGPSTDARRLCHPRNASSGWKIIRPENFWNWPTATAGFSSLKK